MVVMVIHRDNYTQIKAVATCADGHAMLFTIFYHVILQRDSALKYSHFADEETEQQESSFRQYSAKAVILSLCYLFTSVLPPLQLPFRSLVL